MAIKRCHYENAFEAHLAQKGIPFVSIEDVKHLAKVRSGLKLFDYIVYPSDSKAYLVDVKGRKSTGVGEAGEVRQKNWVTQADLDGLSRWSEVFGREFVPTFVFAYWLADIGGEAEGSKSADRHFAFAGRRYSFWLVELNVYMRYQKRLSRRWNTVSVSRERFREISRSLDRAWTTSPC